MTWKLSAKGDERSLMSYSAESSSSVRWMRAIKHNQQQNEIQIWCEGGVGSPCMLCNRSERIRVEGKRGSFLCVLGKSFFSFAACWEFMIGICFFRFSFAFFGSIYCVSQDCHIHARVTHKVIVMYVSVSIIVLDLLFAPGMMIFCHFVSKTKRSKANFLSAEIELKLVGCYSYLAMNKLSETWKLSTLIDMKININLYQSDWLSFFPWSQRQFWHP